MDNDDWRDDEDADDDERESGADAPLSTLTPLEEARLRFFQNIPADLMMLITIERAQRGECFKVDANGTKEYPSK
jgi:hypothetical protein